MSKRKIGKSPALGAPYGGTVTGRLSGSQPAMQRLKPPLLAADQQIVDALRAAFLERFDK